MKLTKHCLKYLKRKVPKTVSVKTWQSVMKAHRKSLKGGKFAMRTKISAKKPTKSKSFKTYGKKGPRKGKHLMGFGNGDRYEIVPANGLPNEFLVNEVYVVMPKGFELKTELDRQKVIQEYQNIITSERVRFGLFWNKKTEKWLKERKDYLEERKSEFNSRDDWRYQKEITDELESVKKELEKFEPKLERQRSSRNLETEF